MGKVMSEESKYKLAHDLGFGEKVEDGDWSDVTTSEDGYMVREVTRSDLVSKLWVASFLVEIPIERFRTYHY